MLKRTYVYAGIILLVVALIAVGCGPKPIQKESRLDTPENHYSQGLRELKMKNLSAASEEFGRSIALDPKYPGGYVGKSLVAMHKEEYDKAMDWVNEALGHDKKFVDAYIAKGRIITYEKDNDKWLDKAVKEFDKALNLDPKSEKALFYKGIAYKMAFDFGEASNMFREVIAAKGDFGEAANNEWELMQKIQRAAPGSKIGMEIALMPEIDRADLAVLFVEELKLLEVLQKKQPKTYDTRFKAPDDPMAPQTQQVDKAVATDIQNHWAKNYIDNMIKSGAIEPFPDGTWRPDDKITRSNYAIFIQNILILVTGDATLATKYIGSVSRFPDVNPTHYAYNAICLSVDRGIMRANTIDGAFGMSQPVSGADALLIIREFQNALRMTF